MDIPRLIQEFKHLRVTVVGDVMLDRYLVGDSKRISEEAPVPIIQYRKDKSYVVPGGAANVAANMQEMGAQVTVVGIIGEDTQGRKLREILEQRKIQPIFCVASQPTIHKVRVVCRNQQMLRYDYEEPFVHHGNAFVDLVTEACLGSDVVVISDYAKGTITPEVMNAVKKTGKLIVVDPKPAHAKWYQDVAVVKPNLGEAQDMAKLQGNSTEEVDIIGKKLVKELRADIVLTRGADGVSVFEKSGEISHLPTGHKEVMDITGAGDTVMAALALCIAKKVPLKEAAHIANVAGGIKVGKAGTATVTAKELEEALGKSAQ